jgi:hypothetical protein
MEDVLMKLSVLALAVASLGGPGCVVVAHDDVDPGDALDAHLVLTWVVNDSKTGARIDCQSAGADTVRVTARNSNTGSIVTDLFDCGVGSGTTYSLTAGDYYINVDLVACRGDRACLRPDVVSVASTVGPYGVWDDADFDLGHFVFLV